MHKLSIFVIIAAVVVSCKDDSVKKEFYADGKLESSVNLNNGLEDGFKTYYLENGTVSKIEFYKNGIVNGAICTFYTNGALKEAFYKINGKQMNNAISLTDSGRIEELLNFIPNYTTTDMYYIYSNVRSSPEKPYTEVISKSTPFFTIDPDADTITLGETYSARVVLNFPLKGYDCHLFHKKIGENDYYLIPGESGHEAIYKEIPNETGMHEYGISSVQVQNNAQSTISGKVLTYKNVFIGRYFVKAK
jgi:hypothetical protein